MHLIPLLASAILATIALAAPVQPQAQTQAKGEQEVPEKFLRMDDRRKHPELYRGREYEKVKAVYPKYPDIDGDGHLTEEDKQLIKVASHQIDAGMPLEPSFRDRLAATGYEDGLKRIDKEFGRERADEWLDYAKDHSSWGYQMNHSGGEE